MARRSMGPDRPLLSGGPVLVLVVSLAVAGVVPGVTFVGRAAWTAHEWNDVPTNNFFHGEIGWLVNNGIANGFTATGQFKPRNDILRQQAALWFADSTAPSP